MLRKLSWKPHRDNPGPDHKITPPCLTTVGGRRQNILATTKQQSGWSWSGTTRRTEGKKEVRWIKKKKMDPPKGDEFTTCENRFVQVVPASKGCIFKNSDKKLFFLFIFLGPQPYFLYFWTPYTYCPPVLRASASSHLPFPLFMLTHSFRRCKKRPAIISVSAHVNFLSPLENQQCTIMVLKLGMLFSPHTTM